MNRLLSTVKLLFNFSLLFPLILSSFASGDAHENEGDSKHIHGSHKECPLPKSREDIIKCAQDFHPSIKRGLFKVKSAKSLEARAGQTPNPIFSSRYVKGETSGLDVSELETNLSFTVELGGKRDSRIQYALAQKNDAFNSIDAIRAKVKVDIILNLFRLRQVFEEKRLLSKALVAFSKVIKKLKNLPRLSAEQEASLTFFEISFEEASIDGSITFEEEKKLEHFFHVATGHSLDEIKSFLPESPKQWPEVSPPVENRLSPELKRLTSMADLAQKDLEIQKANAWPDLKIGPSFSIEKSGLVENKMVGFNIQIPIPLFQMNGGGKTYARSEFARAQNNIVLTKAEEGHERFEQLRVYKSTVDILNKTMSQRLIEEKHKRIVKLYLRGVVSSTVFLDSHKQILNFLKSRNDREMTALKALWSINKFDGKILEEK